MDLMIAFGAALLAAFTFPCSDVTENGNFSKAAKHSTSGTRCIFICSFHNVRFDDVSILSRWTLHIQYNQTTRNLKMKRILALHGVGSSSSILRIQLAAVIKDLGPGYEFTFCDGAFTRDRGPGMASHYPGPFYSYTAGYSPSDIRETLEDLDDFIQDCGPFDGVLGFSQGASMAASYILDHQARCPDEPAPFGFAILLSSVAAFSSDSKYCLSTIQRLIRENYHAACEFPNPIAADLSRPEKLFVDYLASTFKIARKIGATMHDYDISFFKHRDATIVPRVLHSSLTAARIRIPTVHFIGEKDHTEMVEQSLVVLGLCDTTMAQMYQHSGGHAVVSKPQEVDRLVRAIEWAAIESSSQLALNKALNVNGRSVL